MKLFYSYLSIFCAVTFTTLFYSGCTISHTTKMPQLQTGSPLQTVSPKVFAFREFKDERGTSPTFLYRLGASDHVLDQPVSKMFASVICKELERNGHKCGENLQTFPPDFTVEGTVIKYGYQLDKQAFSVKAIANSTVKLTISSFVDTKSVYTNIYQGAYVLSGFAVKPSDALEEALPDMVREFSTDPELVKFISRKFSDLSPLDK